MRKGIVIAGLMLASVFAQSCEKPDPVCYEVITKKYDQHGNFLYAEIALRCEQYYRYADSN